MAEVWQIFLPKKFMKEFKEQIVENVIKTADL